MIITCSSIIDFSCWSSHPDRLEHVHSDHDLPAETASHIICPRRLLLDEVTVKVHLLLVKTIGLSSSCICMACIVGYFREFHGCSILWYPLRIPGSHDPDLSALQLFTSRSTAALQASGSLSCWHHPEVPVGFISWIPEPWTVVDVFWFRTQITEPWKLIWGSEISCNAHFFPAIYFKFPS